MSKMNNLPIGIFDSGVGGLTVYKALHNSLPNERFIYLGDTARVPYGTKSLATVERYAIENSLFLASRGIKMLVVACNTASALALPRIRELTGIEVFGVIGPGGRHAVSVTNGGRIGVIATEATIASNAYHDAVKKVSPDSEVFQTACPLFVPLAEEGWTNEPETYSIAERYLKELCDFDPKAVVLGCTHYPILKNVIQHILGENVILIDSGEATAAEVGDFLDQSGLASKEAIIADRKLCDDLDHFYVTDAAERFARVAERFLGSSPSRLEAVEVPGIENV